jgi:hypothetical protein
MIDPGIPAVHTRARTMSGITSRRRRVPRRLAASSDSSLVVGQPRRQIVGPVRTFVVPFPGFFGLGPKTG